MVGYVANLALCEVVKEIRDQLADFEIDERFFRRACEPNSDVSYDGECLCLYWPSPTTPPDFD